MKKILLTSLISVLYAHTGFQDWLKIDPTKATIVAAPIAVTIALPIVLGAGLGLSLFSSLYYGHRAVQAHKIERKYLQDRETLRERKEDFWDRFEGTKTLYQYIDQVAHLEAQMPINKEALKKVKIQGFDAIRQEADKQTKELSAIKKEKTQLKQKFEQDLTSYDCYNCNSNKVLYSVASASLCAGGLVFWNMMQKK